MKIQLDAKALEAMIGGDTETEIEIRHSIVQAFAKKYLKAIANERIIQAAQSTVNEFVRREVASISWSVASLDSRVAATIREAINKQVVEIINDELETVRKNLTGRIKAAAKSLTDSMDAKIHEQINYATMKEINDRVAARIKQLSADLALAASPDAGPSKRAGGK